MLKINIFYRHLGNSEEHFWSDRDFGAGMGDGAGNPHGYGGDTTMSIYSGRGCERDCAGTYNGHGSVYGFWHCD